MKKTTILFKAILFISTTFALHNLEAATIRDNYFCMSDKNGELSFQPAEVEKWYNVTKNQPFETEISQVEGKKNCINIRSGRKASPLNSEWVRDQLKALGIGWSSDYATPSTYHRLFRTVAYNKLPKELNFAVIGTLTVLIDGRTLVCPNVILAEGSYWTITAPHKIVNNRWIFNNNTSNSHSLTCQNYHNGMTEVVYLGSFRRELHEEKLNFSLDRKNLDENNEDQDI